jgi:hypothetical protein
LLGIGVCGFAVDPNLPADEARLIWLPDYDPGLVVVAPSPQVFSNSASLGVTPAFQRRGPGGNYVVVNNRHSRLPLLLTGGAKTDTSAAIIIPLDEDFAARADAALRVWRHLTGRPQLRPPTNFTVQRRRRLALTLRALDGWLAGETYRVIAQALFGSSHIPTGPGWKTHDLRDRTIRLVRAGISLMRGGYLDLLRRPARHRE